jgi:hypothetical protein
LLIIEQALIVFWSGTEDGDGMGTIRFIPLKLATSVPNYDKPA